MRSRCQSMSRISDLDLGADLHIFGRVGDAAVRHVGDVEQAVHAAEVDERAEVGDVLDDALPHLADGELLHEVLALVRPLVLQDDAAAHDDVAAALVELDDLELEALAEEVVDIGHARSAIWLAGQERVHAHQVATTPPLIFFLSEPMTGSLLS